MTDEAGAPVAGGSGAARQLNVVAAVIVERARLLVVSKRAAPDVFYLPGGKPDPGEGSLEALRRELDEELGVQPVEPRLLAEVESLAALERVPLRLTLFEAAIDGRPHPAAELARLQWISGHEAGLRLSPALSDHVIPLLRRTGALRP
ncbi:NUDIX hydrolase [Streptomyces poriticola]|uniref:NUDIX hydrolase n=1 Tax=Streptomyces poriticola TaxID=3120506 RepID=UPI002FCE4766